MSGAYRWLRWWGDARAAARGAGPLARRKVRSAAHRSLARGLRRWVKP